MGYIIPAQGGGGAFIPLAGTEPGAPATGIIKWNGGTIMIESESNPGTYIGMETTRFIGRVDLGPGEAALLDVNHNNANLSYNAGGVNVAVSCSSSGIMSLSASQGAESCNLIIRKDKFEFMKNGVIIHTIP